MGPGIFYLPVICRLGPSYAFQGVVVVIFYLPVICWADPTCAFQVVVAEIFWQLCTCWLRILATL